MTRKYLRAVLVAGLSASMALSGCAEQGSGTEPPGGEGGCRSLQVVASTTVLGDVAENIIGDGGSVETLMPIGVDPHGFQASARQAASLREADLVVVNGLGLEEGLQDVVDSAAADGIRVLEAGLYVQVLDISGEVVPVGSGDDGIHGYQEGSVDPHIWLDPFRMADVATGIGEALAALDVGCAEERRAAAASYREELLQVDAEVEHILSVVPAGQRTLVTSHAAFGYFADRYGFEIVGVIIPGGSTLAEPSAADLAALVEVLEREGVHAIFAETTQPMDLANTIADELGAEVAVVSLYTGSLGAPGSGAETYIDMLLTDATLIGGALGE
jgi:zinc/manganese transport system substrate-binding protein